MTILITGATGNIGGQLARELLDRGEKIRAASRRPKTLSALSELGAEVVRLDLEDPTTHDAAFAGVERMFLVGPQGGPDFGAQVGPVLAAASRAGVKHVLRYSALGADPDAGFALAREHGIAEQLVKDSGIGWTLLGPTFYQDNLINFAGDSIRGQSTWYGASGTGKTAYVSSADIARTAATILENPDAHAGNKYTLTGPEAVTDAELAGLATEVLGREISYVDLPADKLAAGMREHGMPEWMVESMVALEGIKRDGYAAEISSDIRDVTGHEPETYRSFLERNRGKLA